jgi:release factor glutamine methyltransferase
VNEVWTPLRVLEWTAGRFRERGLESARLDAEVLLAHALKTNRVGLYTGFDKPLAAEELTAYRELVKRRLAGEPVAYLVGEQEFWSLPLKVDARVLIPRRDTETLVEVGLKRVRSGGTPCRRIADVATGSGAVALALAVECPGAVVIATDASEGALEVAAANVERHALGARVTLRHGDLLGPLAGEEPFDLIVSNPPYVPRGEIDGLAREVKAEPRAALDGGVDGLDLIRPLVAGAPALLAAGGMLAVEHTAEQGARVRALLEGARLGEVRTTKDLAGLDRVTSGIKAG